MGVYEIGDAGLRGHTCKMDGITRDGHTVQRRRAFGLASEQCRFYCSFFKTL